MDKSKILDEHDERKKFKKWRERVSDGLPELSNRVFSLRGKQYEGSGFHWVLEKSLGFVIHRITNYDETLARDLLDRVTMEVVVETLYKDVHKAEMSVYPLSRFKFSELPPPHVTVMTRKQWVECARDRSLLDSDGFGFASNGEKMDSNYERMLTPSKWYLVPKEITHIVWFNR